MTDPSTDHVYTSQPTEGEQSFFTELARQDKGRLAILRRNAGNNLAEARGITWFYELLARYSHGRNEELYFLVATLFASDKAAVEHKGSSKGDFGATMHALRAKSSSSASLDRRFNILLDADYEPNTGGELAYRIRQATKFIISKKDPSVRINWPQLLQDLKRWNTPNKTTHKKWARSYYAPTQDTVATDVAQDV